MNQEVREGYYKDKAGGWQPDRRATKDRRARRSTDSLDHERRGLFRRKADLELLKHDHKEMIDEALEDFAKEHGGHL